MQYSPGDVGPASVSTGRCSGEKPGSSTSWSGARVSTPASRGLLILQKSDLILGRTPRGNRGDRRDYVRNRIDGGRPAPARDRSLGPMETSSGYYHSRFRKQRGRDVIPPTLSKGSGRGGRCGQTGTP